MHWHDLKEEMGHVSPCIFFGKCILKTFFKKSKYCSALQKVIAHAATVSRAHLQLKFQRKFILMFRLCHVQTGNHLAVASSMMDKVQSLT